MAIVTVSKTVSIPIQLERKEVNKKVEKKKIAGFSAVGTYAARQLSPGDDAGDGGLGGHPDDDDADGRDDDDTIDMIDRAKNHLAAMDDEDSPDASTERLAKAHALLSRALAKRRGAPSPHTVTFARA
jgi:hypothetical protein